MRRKSFLACIALTLLSLIPSLSLAWSGKVIGVADGDTITLLRDGKQISIRLYGIDCPEKGQPFSNRAKQFTSNMVSGNIVEVGPININHYGQTVALVYIDGKGLCDELIREGLAWVYYLYCNLPICAEWKNLESEAKQAKRGLWSEPDPVAPWEFASGKTK